MSGALLVCCSASGVGKSTVVAGICRLLARQGVSVAPFKAQNMSNHAAVTADGGGAAEINLLDRDLVNLPLAAATDSPVLVVVDIDRGGASAAAHGTIDLVPRRLRATIGGIVFNRFRGDPTLLDPGIRDLDSRTGVPVLGVLPHLGDRLGSIDADLIGICAGQQMLGSSIVDQHESSAGAVDGLGLTPLRTTSLHGIFDADDFRTSLLADVAHRRRRVYTPSPCSYGDALRLQHDRLADRVADHVDVGALRSLAATAGPAGAAPGW